VGTGGLDLLILGQVHECGFEGEDVRQVLAEVIHPLGHDPGVVVDVALKL
jgi:hypothetical protein